MSRGATDNHQPTDPWPQAASVGRLFFFLFHLPGWAGTFCCFEVMCIHRGDDYYEMGAGLFLWGGYLFCSRGFFCLHISASPARWGCTLACSFLLLVESKKKMLPSDRLF